MANTGISVRDSKYSIPQVAPTLTLYANNAFIQEFLTLTHRPNSCLQSNGYTRIASGPGGALSRYNNLISGLKIFL